MSSRSSAGLKCSIGGDHIGSGDFYLNTMAETTYGFVIAGSSSARAVKSVSWRVSCEMEVTRVEQRAYIKIAALRERNAMDCRSELVESLGNNALPYRTVARWVVKFQPGRMLTCDEQRSGRFTQGVANAEADGIQRLLHR
ncbi:HTH_48 domain-containing protein [Trichonephila clavipes]|nr:HTH_48 domain-containing protein [Trichonephila clavipes]